jgi:hypothetical protein
MKVNEAEKTMEKEKDLQTGSQGTAMMLASYHIHGLINYYRGNLEHVSSLHSGFSHWALV